MNPAPTNRLPSTCTTGSLGLGQARRSRFFLQFERWRHKFRTLRHALAQCGMPLRVYYRWKNGRVIPKETALRRYCLSTGIDLTMC